MGHVPIAIHTNKSYKVPFPWPANEPRQLPLRRRGFVVWRGVVRTFKHARETHGFLRAWAVERAAELGIDDATIRAAIFELAARIKGQVEAGAANRNPLSLMGEVGYARAFAVEQGILDESELPDCRVLRLEE